MNYLEEFFQRYEFRLEMKQISLVSILRNLRFRGFRKNMGIPQLASRSESGRSIHWR